MIWANIGLGHVFIGPITWSMTSRTSLMSSTTDLTGQMIIAGTPVRGSGAEIRGFDPAAGPLEPVYRTATPQRRGRLRRRRRGLRRLPRHHLRAARAVPRSDRRQHRGHQRRPHRPRRRRDPACPQARITGEVGRTTGQLRLFAGVLREGSWNGARIDPALPDRTPLPRPDIRQRKHPARPGRRVRREQLPARVLRRRRRHRLGARRRLPRRRQGPRRAPRHLRTGRPRHHRRRRRRRPARGHVLAAVRLRPGTRHRTGHRPPHQGRRLHRITFRRNGSGRRCRRRGPSRSRSTPR